MTIERAWALVLAAAMFLAVSTIRKQESQAPVRAVLAHPEAQTSTVIDSGAGTSSTRDDDWAEPRVDLNGNEVDVAVSDYRVDGRGELYERHAPDTALIHLSAPKL